MYKVFFVVIVLTLQACSTAPKAYLTQANLQNHDLIAMDSRLRVIVETEQGIFSTSGIVEPQRIICTEPSPDVATTIANSLGVGLSVLGYGSGSLSTQQVEGLVQLGERTAAIQLLRDKMYQTCLAYANGAITGTNYSLIMSRLDDTIVTLSLGDGVAGAFGRKLAGIGGKSEAKADATLIGLPGEISKIEDQAGKLAAANKKVDDAEEALKAHKATQPAKGKEEEYKAQTKKLENNIATAKGERNALLELLRSTAKTASEASGEITQLHAGGGLQANPNADVLGEMQANFLLTDISRDFISACIVELGLRKDTLRDNDNNLQNMIDELEAQFREEPSATTGANYAGAILRNRGTALATYCVKNLKELIKMTSDRLHEYRMQRAKLSAKKATERYAGEAAKHKARNRKLFIESIKLCNSEFKKDAERKKACLDQVIPIIKK